MKHFEKYMMERLYGDYEYTYQDLERTKDLDFVKRYYRDKHVTSFQMSHGVFQVNSILPASIHNYIYFFPFSFSSISMTIPRSFSRRKDCWSPISTRTMFVLVGLWWISCVKLSFRHITILSRRRCTVDSSRDSSIARLPSPIFVMQVSRTRTLLVVVPVPRPIHRRILRRRCVRQLSLSINVMLHIHLSLYPLSTS